MGYHRHRHPLHRPRRFPRRSPPAPPRSGPTAHQTISTSTTNGTKQTHLVTNYQKLLDIKISKDMISCLWIRIEEVKKVRIHK